MKDSQYWISCTSAQSEAHCYMCYGQRQANYRAVVLYLDWMKQNHCPQQTSSDTSFLPTLLSVTHVQAQCQWYVSTQYTNIFSSVTVIKKSSHVWHREFQQTFLAWSTHHYLANKFKTMCSVLDKKIKQRCHILTEEKLDTGASLESYPKNQWQH
jgi:hypothetical protein